LFFILLLMISYCLNSDLSDFLMNMIFGFFLRPNGNSQFSILNYYYGHFQFICGLSDEL
jgi:hypothetical protein